MAAPLLQLKEISLGFDGDPLFKDISLIVEQTDKLALVGRNGSGKSTLMRLMSGALPQDSGEIISPSGIHIAYMAQEPDMEGHASLFEWASSPLEAHDLWKIERAADGLGCDLSKSPADSSGGERRKAALARLLAEEPDLMLLDEPTNHLDLSALIWLENYLAQSQAAMIAISHDRAFLGKISRATLWLDRGRLRKMNKGFATFEDWRDKIHQEEDLARKKMDQKIRSEGKWAVEGISARRKRNQGRLRALNNLKQERAALVRRTGSAAMEMEQAPTSGKLAIEAHEISKALGGKILFRPFSIKIARGDRIALMGPNGAGKTTLLRCLLKEEAPDHGRIKHGSRLQIAYFDQHRAQLKPDMSLWDAMTQDPELAVKGGSDQIMVRGVARHVVGYLKEFLFDERQARSPISTLSGGERARLLLAKLMAQPINLLALDEPTNDLDVETLDLFEEVLSQFNGTVLLISHDRDFVDRIATTTLAFEPRGNLVAYAGGYHDALSQGAQLVGAQEPKRKKASISASKKTDVKQKVPEASSGLNFTEKHRLEKLPDEIDTIERDISKLSDLLAQPDFYASDPERFAKASKLLSKKQETLRALEEEWISLAERDEAPS